MTWQGIKRGDEVLVVSMLGGARERMTTESVASVGRKWITTAGHGKPRFDVETGWGEYSTCVHTRASLAEWRLRVSLLRVVCDTTWRNVDTFTLEEICALLP